MNKKKNLQYLACQVEKILKEELHKEKISNFLAQVRVYNIKTVGVQGDERSYNYPAEIELYQGRDLVWKPKFLENLSSRITNEVKGINRVLYVTSKRK
ncbi:MAG: hypothetical protein AABX65_02690 [Nanoarchaeota archaeon]